MTKIKNPDRIHLIHKGRYICIRSVKPTKEKSTTNIKEITCKNCKRIINSGYTPFATAFIKATPKRDTKEPTLKRIFLAPGRAMLDFWSAETVISVLFWLLLVFILT